MRTDWNHKVLGAILIVLAFSCMHPKPAPPDGQRLQDHYLLDNNLRKDYSAGRYLSEVIASVNCIDSGVMTKKIVLAGDFTSSDTNQILLIPYIPNGANFKSSSYSDIANRVILLNPSYIREFARTNALNDTLAYIPLLELMLLHEIGHFILHQSGYFDRITTLSSGKELGEQRDDTQPEFLTSVKKIELAADSLAIGMVRRQLPSGVLCCGGQPFEIQLVIPGMQFNLAGTRDIENFGSPHINFLHDPNPDHPNLELRITFMNYFLNPNDTLRQMIDDYLYERTVAPVHRQETDPKIFQGEEKKLTPS